MCVDLARGLPGLLANVHQKQNVSLVERVLYEMMRGPLLVLFAGLGSTPARAAAAVDAAIYSNTW